MVGAVEALSVAGAVEALLVFAAVEALSLSDAVAAGVVAVLASCAGAAFAAATDGRADIGPALAEPPIFTPDVFALVAAGGVLMTVLATKAAATGCP